MSLLMHSFILLFTHVFSTVRCVCVCVCVGGEIQINLQLDVCCELFLFFYRLHYFILIQSDFISSFVSGFI